MKAKSIPPAMKYYLRNIEINKKQYKEKRTRDFWWMGLTLAFSTLMLILMHLSNFKEEKEKIHIRF